MTRAALSQADLLISEALTAAEPGDRSVARSCRHIHFHRLSMREINRVDNIGMDEVGRNQRSELTSLQGAIAA